MRKLRPGTKVVLLDNIYGLEGEVVEILDSSDTIEPSAVWIVTNKAKYPWNGVKHFCVANSWDEADEALKVYTEDKEFNIGDRVITTEGEEGFYGPGNIGTIVDIYKYDMVVEFDLGQEGLRGVSGNYSWWVNKENAKIVQDKSWLWKFFNTGL